MRVAWLCVSATLTLAAAAPAALAASACTNFVELASDNRQTCAEMVRERARSAGFDGRRTEETVFFWFGSNVVTARCIGNSLIALAAYHQQQDRACPLLDRIGDAMRPTRKSAATAPLTSP